MTRLRVGPAVPAGSGVQANGWIWRHEFGALAGEAVTE